MNDETQDFSTLGAWMSPYKKQTPSWMGISRPNGSVLPADLQPYGSSAMTPVATPAPSGFIGADYEQMPMGSYGLAPNEGMFAGSAVNSPLTSNAVAKAPATGLQKWLADQGIIGSTDANGIKTEGYGGLALGAAQGLGSLYMGMQQYNLAKDSLANNKAQFERNFAASKATTNAQLEDRQRARVASNANAYQSVGDYMTKNGVR